MIQPHGGNLINCYDSDRNNIISRAIKAPSTVVNSTAMYDAQMIANGAYSPLNGFMNRQTYESVLEDMRLPDGTIWSIPILLQVTKEEARKVEEGLDVELMSANGELVGILELEEVFPVNVKRVCEKVFNVDWEHRADHPGVVKFARNGSFALAGKLRALKPKKRPPETLSPFETRAYFAAAGWNRITAFQTRNPLHRAHEYLLRCALEVSDGLFVHPLVGETKSDDIPANVRWKAYRAVLDNYFPKTRVLLSAFPAAMRYAGPREAILHAIARKNYGATHFIVGRDHAGVGDFYGTYDAQNIFSEFDSEEVGIEILRFEHAFYDKRLGMIATSKTSPNSQNDKIHLSGTKVRQLLKAGKGIPEELSRPEVVAILGEFYQQR